MTKTKAHQLSFLLFCFLTSSLLFVLSDELSEEKLSIPTQNMVLHELDQWTRTKRENDDDYPTTPLGYDPSMRHPPPTAGPLRHLERPIFEKDPTYEPKQPRHQTPPPVVSRPPPEPTS
ncbi:hypothetical protein PIB30_108595 [Stylosanthes scabra]|uniref:Transmembrane protein n=1 Tax=Stylosanthes scabra TaxID=79078 RepID=A0ABU6RZB2_9FABA|nr:hypothetical protein [Stylosanthes scabra]